MPRRGSVDLYSWQKALPAAAVRSKATAAAQKPNATQTDPRHHLLFLPPEALRKGIWAIYGDASIMERLRAGTCRMRYFARIPQTAFNSMNRDAFDDYVEFKFDWGHEFKGLRFIPHSSDDLLNVGNAVRILSYLLADSDVGCLNEDAPEFLIDLGAKLTELRIRINNADGSLERY